MATKCCASGSCFLSSYCHLTEFQDTCPTRSEKFNRGQAVNIRGETVYIILSGVALGGISLESEEEEMQLALLGRGDVHGMMTPFSESKVFSSFHALTQLEVCKISALGLRRYTKQDPSILYSFMLGTGAGFHSMFRHSWIRKPRKIYDRVLRALFVLNELDGQDLAICHEDIALIVNADRPSVTHALDMLRNNGMVHLEYRKVHLNPTLTSRPLEFALKRDYVRAVLGSSLTNQTDDQRRRGSSIAIL